MLYRMSTVSRQSFKRKEDERRWDWIGLEGKGTATAGAATQVSTKCRLELSGLVPGTVDGSSVAVHWWAPDPLPLLAPGLWTGLDMMLFPSATVALRCREPFRLQRRC
jgi:hypothetical protein